MFSQGRSGCKWRLHAWQIDTRTKSHVEGNVSPLHPMTWLTPEYPAHDHQRSEPLKAEDAYLQHKIVLHSISFQYHFFLFLLLWEYWKMLKTTCMLILSIKRWSGVWWHEKNRSGQCWLYNDMMVKWTRWLAACNLVLPTLSSLLHIWITDLLTCFGWNCMSSSMHFRTKRQFHVNIDTNFQLTDLHYGSFAVWNETQSCRDIDMHTLIHRLCDLWRSGVFYFSSS